MLAEVRRHDSNATRDYREMVVHTLAGLKLLAPHVTVRANLRPIETGSSAPHVSAALYQTLTEARFAPACATTGMACGSPAPGSRKIKGSVRLALALPRATAAADYRLCPSTTQ